MSDKITHALISVSDKEGIVEFAKGLTELDIVILSTGGTASLLKQHQIPVQDISLFTGFPEMMGGRVKTLHPKLYGGILARGEEDKELLAKYQMPVIGLVVVNLYPFEKTISRSDCTLEEAIENIDIGGPTLLRAGAKNFNHTTVVVCQKDYETVLTELRHEGHTSQELRLTLAKKVFAHVANYDIAINHYFSNLGSSDNHFPEQYQLSLKKKFNLRYGENPHQHAAFYALEDDSHDNISHAIAHSGKPLSYNNIADADTALECVRQFDETACVIVKHVNPCAVSIGNNQLEAYQTAFHADSSSAFGGIIAFNTPLQTTTLEAILSNQFVEVIIAPSLSEGILSIAEQKPNLRILTVQDLLTPSLRTLEFKSVNGGLLVQERDNLPTPVKLEIVTKAQPSNAILEDLLFAWKVVRFIKSNAIVFAKNKSTLGIGPGQMSRIFSTKIASLKAKEANLSLKGAVLASDAFFPFRDSIDEAALLGITAIIQPGGSIRDQEVIAAADEKGIAMAFTHLRHFRH